STGPGPLELATTPPRSASPTLTPAGAGCWAFTGAGGAPTSAAMAIAATLRKRPALTVMTGSSLSSNHGPFWLAPAQALRAISMHKRPSAATRQGEALPHTGHEPGVVDLICETSHQPICGARCFVALISLSQTRS